MCDNHQAGQPPSFLTRQLSLAIPPWVGKMSAGDEFGYH